MVIWQETQRTWLMNLKVYLMMQWNLLRQKKIKILLKEQSDTIKELGLKIRKLEEKVTTNEETIARLDERVSSLEGTIEYLETQDKLKPKKLDNLQ